MKHFYAIDAVENGTILRFERDTSKTVFVRLRLRDTVEEEGLGTYGAETLWWKIPFLFIVLRHHHLFKKGFAFLTKDPSFQVEALGVVVTMKNVDSFFVTTVANA